MPSPIAHAVSGYAVTKLLEPQSNRGLYKFPLLCYGSFVAIAADIDFLPKLIAGIDMHRGFTHSLAFAIVFSLVVNRCITEKTRFARLKYLRAFILTFILYCSHLVLDFFTQGGSGLPLLWPLSTNTFHSTIPLFPAVHHSRGLFDTSHLRFISFELVYSTLLLWCISRWKTYQNQRDNNTLGA